MLDTVIIIPYRSREKHLKYYIDNTVPLLKKNMPNSKVVVIEQDWNNKLFNRGCLINIGVKEYENKTTHIMTHDVDINPFEETILKYYIEPIPDNNIKGIFTSMTNTLGGIIKLKCDTFLNINGFPNDIWGWGHEDKALQNRSEFKELKITKNILSNDPNIEKYFLRFNDINDRVRPSNFNFYYNKYYNNKTNIEDVVSSGLNNLQYKILEKTNINDYVETIKVSI
jgi:hypothetical protein